mmetsp:Transcript_21646/g.44412  ORF Transcript_21646/g.44412 Transcript_21646/m.44412 type:complete len:95 (-) Transcript_21646:1443-1727(-)
MCVALTTFLSLYQNQKKATLKIKITDRIHLLPSELNTKIRVRFVCDFVKIRNPDGVRCSYDCAGLYFIPTGLLLRCVFRKLIHQFCVDFCDLMD